jgi:ATP-binding cassette subfamily B protein
MEQGISIKRRAQIIWRTLRIAWRVRSTAVIGYFAGAFLEIAGFLVAIYATAKLGSLLATFVANGHTEGIWFWLWVDIIAGAITGLGFLAMDYFKRILFFPFVRWTINSFLAAHNRLDIAAFYDNEMRNKLNKVAGTYIWQMPDLAQISLELIYGTLRFMAITVVVSQITWWLVPLIAIFLIPSLIAESRLAQVQWFVWDTKGDFRHIFWGLEYIVREAKGQMELRTTQAKDYVLRKINRMNEEFYGEQQARLLKANRIRIPTKIVEAAGTAVGSIVVLRQLLNHSISLERYFFLSGALLRIGGALNSIFGTLSRMQEHLLLADSYFALIDSQPELTDKPDAVKLNPKKVPEVIFKDVSFTYPDQTTPVFENLNLHIHAGEHMALVGENGAGKSTFIKLLLRFYRPTSGQILINGHDLQDIAIESWYEQLATLFQDFNKYPLSIAENIEIGRSKQKPDPKLLEKAGSFGGVNEMVAGYKHGWETVLNASFKKGVEPSGGQWQRVALARAFYRDANMIILDEPTSAIDAKAEYDIFNNIFDHYKNKTALLVSHRFSTVRRADTIVVLDHGKVVEQGSHRQLIKQKGLYYDMFSKQAEGYR